MNMLVLGGTGFIGSALSREAARNGHEVVVASRLPRPDAGGIRHALWDGVTASSLARIMDGMDAVVNLVGENLASARWSESRKQRIVQSRVRAGDAVTEAMSALTQPPGVLLQGSAVGFYGVWPDAATAPDCTEDAPRGEGFLARTVAAWEDSTLPVERLGVRRCLLRTAPVLGRGGLLDKMAPLFRFGLGGPVGSGLQPFSWVHLSDHVRASLFLLHHADAAGVFNMASPFPVTMNQFARALAHVFHRPAWLRAPAPAVRLALGEMADELLLEGQKALPEHLLTSGFSFTYPKIETALGEIF